MSRKVENLRNTKPVSLYPLSPEDALRRAMEASEPEPTKPKKKTIHKPRRKR